MNLELIADRWIIMEPFTKFLFVFMPLAAVIFPIVRNILVKTGKSLKIWVICSFIPLILCGVHLILNWCGSNTYLILDIFWALYVAAVFFPLMTPLCRKKAAFHIVSVICAVVVCTGTLFSFVLLGSLHARIVNFSRMSMVDSYHALIAEMKHYYPLNEWKQIDYDAIDAELLPMAEKAQQTEDYFLYSEMLERLVYLTYDGHFGAFLTDSDKGLEDYIIRHMQYNYGMIVYPVSDGTVRAFMVEEGSEAQKAGIAVGTVITAWNGKPILTAIKETANTNILYSNYPVQENEDFIRPLILSVSSGEKIEVGFLDAGGNEKTVSITGKEEYFTRLNQAIDRLLHIHYNEVPEDVDGLENFRTKMLTDKVGYMRVAQEVHDTFLDAKSYVLGNYPEIQEIVRNRLNELKSRGMEKLVLDLRGNLGGNPYISTAIASMFTDKNTFAFVYGGTADHRMNMKVEMNGEGTFKDLPVVVLVNMTCGSSGDYLADMMGKYDDHAKVVGMTTSMNIGQAVGVKCMLPGNCLVAFPVIHSLEENGDYAIDTKPDRKNRVSFDEKIPVTLELATALFDGQGDPELDAAAAMFDE